MQHIPARFSLAMTHPPFDIVRLPDYAALQQLARALWRNGSVRGASVLVGAGLSKNAERPSDDSPEPPLWWELLDKMIERLYPHDEKAAPMDPLRIAEEYRTYFGQAGLDDFIRTHFPDRSWSPGTLHTDLLELPWTDVLTTNWDTLLERASENTVEYSYEIVRTEADLTHARSPRIVKLHGSIGDAGPLIFTEEDYRTYPAQYAAFVNLARQVFIENELCLVGFSGDDPNFLKWAGWVRDHLGGSARRIYLVGNLRLERATRKYLEAHNIAPIDLAPSVEHLARKDQHAAATRIFLEHLRNAKPPRVSEWNRTPMTAFPLLAAGPDIYQRISKDHALAAGFLKKTVRLLEADRENYPGWLVCPVQHRSQLQHGGGVHWLVRKPVLDLLEPQTRAGGVSAVLWRHTVGFFPLEEALTAAMTEMLETPSSEIAPSLRLELAIALMRHARLSHDDDGLNRWAVLIETEAPTNAPMRQDAQYQQCLRARDRMDLMDVKAGLARLTSNDPIWKLRRAALHTEVGEYEKATKLIKDSAADLERRHRLDRNSLSIKSLLAWANWINRASVAGDFRSSATGPRPRNFKELEIDPLGEIEYLENEAQRIAQTAREENAAIQPTFEAGYYRDGSTSIRIRDYDPGLKLFYDLDRLTESVGLPFSINHVNVCASAAIAVLAVAYQPTVEWYVGFLRALHSHLDRPFERYFGRISVAQLNPDLVSRLISTVETAITFWSTQLRNSNGPDLKDDHGCALDKLRLLLVVLSRLTVRMSAEHAARTFKMAIRFATDPLFRHNWLLEALSDLAKYSAAAVPTAAQGALALAVIEFPLKSERNTNDDSWSRLVSAIWGSTPNREPADKRWDNRINQLIASAAKDQAARREATLRLVYLSIRNALKPEEVRSFGHALWSDLDGLANALPINTDIISSFFAHLPAPDGIDVVGKVAARLFAPDLRQFMLLEPPFDTRDIANRHEHLMSLINTNHVGLTMPPDIAARMFDEIVVWEPQILDRTDPFAVSFVKKFNDGVRSFAGDLLTIVLVPSMLNDDRTLERAQTLLAFVRRVRGWRGLGALPEFLASAPTLSQAVTATIHAGLVSSEFQHVGGATTAITRWAKLAQGKVLQELPRSLVERLIFAIETCQEAGLQPMLSCALGLLKENFLETEDFRRLVTALERIHLEFTYDSADSESVRAVSISLVRADCARLAVALIDRIADDGTLRCWIDAAKSDPLPEVRFSI